MADQFRPQGVDPLVDRIAEPDRTGLDLLTTGIESVNQQGFQSYLEDRQDQRTEQTIEGQRSVQADRLMDERASEYRSAAQSLIDSTYEALALLDPNDPGHAEAYAEGQAFIADLQRVIAGTYQAATPEELRGVVAEGAGLLSAPVSAEVRSLATQSQREREDAVSERAHANAVEILEITQRFQGDQNEMNRQLQVLLTEMNINSAEEIAALDRELRQQEVANNIDLSWAQHALAERAQDLAEAQVESGELSSAADTYQAMMDFYLGRMDEPGAREAVDSILESAQATMGDSWQLEALRSYGGERGPLYSGAAVDAVAATQVERRQAELDLAIAEYDFAAGVTQDEIDMQTAMADRVRAAVEGGRPWEVRQLAQMAEVNPSAFVGIHFDGWVDEDGNAHRGVLSLAEEYQAEIAEDRGLARQQVQAQLDAVEIGNAASQAAGARSVAETLYGIKDDELFEARLASVRNHPNFSALGGEAYIQQIRNEVEFLRLVEAQSEEDQNVTAFLEAPVDSDQWENHARFLLENNRGFSAYEAAELARFLRAEGHSSALAREISNRAMYNQLAGGAEPLSFEERKLHADLAELSYKSQVATIEGRYSHCLAVGDSIEQVAQTTCTDEERAEMYRLLANAEVALNDQLNFVSQGVPIPNSLDSLMSVAGSHLRGGTVDEDGNPVTPPFRPAVDILNHLTPDQLRDLSDTFVRAGNPVPNAEDLDRYPLGEDDLNYQLDADEWVSRFSGFVTHWASGRAYVSVDRQAGTETIINPPAEGSTTAQILLQAQRDAVAAAAGVEPPAAGSRPDGSERSYGFPGVIEGVADAAQVAGAVAGLVARATGQAIGDAVTNFAAWMSGNEDALVERSTEIQPAPGFGGPDFSQYEDVTAESFASVSGDGRNATWPEVNEWVDGSGAAKSIADTFSHAGFTITSSPTTVYDNGNIHHGIDISSGNPAGTMANSFFNQPVTIVSTRESESLGNVLVVETQDGLRFQIGHIDPEDWGTDFYAPGKVINPGEPLAREGNTGWTEGPTGVHFDIQWVDHENSPFSNRPGMKNHTPVDQITMGFAYALAPRDILEQAVAGGRSDGGS